MTWLAATLALCAWIGDPRPPDVVELVGGRKLEGRVVYQDAEKLVLRVGSNDKDLAMKEVASVRSRAADLADVVKKWRALKPDDVAGTMQLADACKKQDLDEAGVMAWDALAYDPWNEAAHVMLGHLKKDEGWSVREKTRVLEYEKLGNLRKDWNDAWVLPTTHYALRSNQKLVNAVAAAMDLECFYRSFFDLFQIELGLREVVEPMGAEVHADKKSFPESVGGRPAYFDPSANVLYVNAEGGVRRGDLFHEATHQILHNTAERVRSGRGDIPGWLNEGLAEYMAAGMSGPEARASFATGALDRGHFRVHALAKDPYDLSRVLAFGSEDFGASSKADLKYAQSYTLVQFCLHGEYGKHRKAFLAFMRGTYEGHASGKDFKDAIGMRESELEKAWTAYVKGIAGVK